MPDHSDGCVPRTCRIDSSMATAKTYQSPPMCLRKGACQYVLASVVQHRHVAVFEGEVAAVVLLDGSKAKLLPSSFSTATYCKPLAPRRSSPNHQRPKTCGDVRLNISLVCWSGSRGHQFAPERSGELVNVVGAASPLPSARTACLHAS